MNMKKKLLFVFGTRPEAIKMAPLIKACQQQAEYFTPIVCLTAQHRQMLDQVIDFFELPVHDDLDLMKPNQTLYHITADALLGLQKVIDKQQPDLVLVQGDTTTAFAGALAAFYAKVPVAHVEAGLRSGNNYSPFPEEVNRKLIGQMASWHFAPTQRAVDNLAQKDILGQVFLTGNTVIDALLMGLEKVKDDAALASRFSFVDPAMRMILVTGHRRESFGQPFEEICLALRTLADRYPDVQIVYPVHLNPNVREPVYRWLEGHPRIHLIAPVDYPAMIWLMHASYLVLTDSGGVQEEAPTLGKPVLVMREVTERTEGIDAGTAKLVGTNSEVIIREASLLLDNQEAYHKMANAVNPYGDGTTSQQILKILKENL
jgi:UDP-N-acetylglucosamine 2-epimerase (non-hydrolysing)